MLEIRTDKIMTLVKTTVNMKLINIQLIFQLQKQANIKYIKQTEISPYVGHPGTGR